jgi:hypothetical protein
MSLALKSDSFESPQPQRRSTSPRVSRPIPLRPRSPHPALALVHRLQWVSSLLATTILALCLLSYGASVYMDQQVGRAARRLSQLQHSQQQMATFNAVLKSQMAAQAQLPSSGLQPPTPEAVVFLAPATPRPGPTQVTPGSSGLPLGVGRPPPGD